jgi:hypothetical protein
MPASIWKDYEVSFGSVDEADYTIEAGGAAIYSGHAVRRPDQAQLTVRINDVCADYLLHALPSVSTKVSTAEDSAVTFTVKDGGGSTVDSVQFVADWSYDYDHTPSALSDPVNGRVSAQQALLFSVLGTSGQTVGLAYQGGATASVSVTASGGPVQVISVPLSSYTGLDTVTAGGKTYKVVDECNRYALAYVNAFGGWDTLLMEGRCSLADGYDRHTMLQRYDNAAQSARGRVEYANEVTRRWTLRTGWLTDGQAGRMHHVLGSTHVYLYDISDAVLIPVVITEQDCEYKTYRGNGGQLVNYVIGVELAQEITRR